MYNRIFNYFDTSNIGWIKILSSKTHRNQNDDRLPGMGQRPLTKLPHVL